MVEKIYNKRRGDYFKLVHDDEKGVRMIASRDIEAGLLVLVDPHLYSQPLGYSSALMQRPEVAPLMATIQKCAQTHGHLAGAKRYPPEVQQAMNRMTEWNASMYMSKSSRIDEIWELHDAHRQAEIGDQVMIDGLVSKAGKQLNGKKGCVVSRDKHDASRFGVEIQETGGKKSIKACNLKTLGGIVHTNSFEGDGCQVLYKIICRINHACGDAANVLKIDHQGKGFVMAKRNIKAGEEILIDYIPGEQEDRLGLLKLKYNFVCACPEH